MIYIVGIGTGFGDYSDITLRAVQIIRDSEIIVGSKRQVELAKKYNQNANIVKYEKITDIIKILKENTDRTISVLASGNPSLYGIADFIIKNMRPFEDIQIISGISSVEYLFSKLKITMNDLYITSFHGRKLDEEMILKSKKTAFFTDNKTRLYDIAQIYLKNKLNPQFIIGENLSYPKEKIIRLRADEIKVDDKFEMYILIVINE
ncbi:precorrin-6y C5,15-methyltransferase (decarboxylating), CbiE subunit [[Eubacterium] yurii subsp. margaretiae ATCC 43715]|nr:precorrin-6y C5,15-methyltransferase (decarboxylating), CbiE subunit [[Eubacterium] yurii subsp. margaretiae ATCC 43715]